MAEIDKTMPEGRWKFDAEVANVFDDMLRRSIPQIDVMRDAVFDLAVAFATPKTEIIDLGCSKGDAIARLVEKLYHQNHFLGVELSKPMLAAATERFRTWTDTGVVRIVEHDLRKGLPRGRPASVVLAVLTLQFIPIEYRHQIVEAVYQRLAAGGAFIVVEKVLGATSLLDEIMVTNYLRLKEGSGYTREEIDRKRASLEGVLVPVTAEWNVQILEGEGFKVDCFWRWMNFAGWIAVKR